MSHPNFFLIADSLPRLILVIHLISSYPFWYSTLN